MYSKAKLNAISRSVAERNKREALNELAEAGIDFSKWCKMFGYKASPTRLATAIRKQEPKTITNLERYKEGTCIIL